VKYAEYANKTCKKICKKKYAGEYVKKYAEYA
jgi:hypothetical protein